MVLSYTHASCLNIAPFPCSPRQLITRFNREAVLLRLMFLGNAKRGGPSHTVLVTDVPGIVTVGVGDVRPMPWFLMSSPAAGELLRADDPRDWRSRLASNPCRRKCFQKGHALCLSRVCCTTPTNTQGVTDMMNKAVNKIRTHVSGDGADTGKKKRTVGKEVSSHAPVANVAMFVSPPQSHLHACLRSRAGLRRRDSYGHRDANAAQTAASA